MKPDAIFKTEAALCAAFIASLPGDWQLYAETAGWDILLVRRIDGCQIGVQAKLKLNAKVLLQAVEGPWYHETGPDYRMVLVPSGSNNELAALAAHCCLTVVIMHDPAQCRNPPFWPPLPRQRSIGLADACGDDEDHWFEMMPTRRHHLPDYIPDVAAGVPSPLQLTRWKITALRLAVLLEATGYLTRTDFKVQQMDIRRWIDGSGWLVPGEPGFVRGPRFPDFRRQHPVVWDQIVADEKRWQRSTPLMMLPAVR